MPKAMIVTVGAQAEQVIFSLRELEPEYIGLLGTNTQECRNSINEVAKAYPLPLTCFKVLYTEDNSKEIGKLVYNFYEIYNWIRKQGIDDKEIIVDPTGGRKWMSAGAIMIASFLGLEMVYVDVTFREGKPDPSTMKIVHLGNAYEQTGFLEELKADELFNKYNYKAAHYFYKFLSHKISDPRKMEIKGTLSAGFLCWGQFKFEQAYKLLKDAYAKIRQYGLLKEYETNLNNYLEILEILQKNDQPNASYFQLIRDNNFAEKILLTLLSQSERYAEIHYFDQAVICLYRILEFISQIRLAHHNIDTNNITQDIREKYNFEFKRITKKIFQGETEIPDKIALVHGWILLYCLKDELLREEKENFLKGLREHIGLRDLLWIEHRNKGVEEGEYRKFKKYVEMWVSKLDKNFNKKLVKYKFIKFE